MRPTSWTWLGAVVAWGVTWALFLSYFFIAVDYPDLRDSGHLHVVAVWAGALAVGWFCARAWRARRQRVVTSALLVLALLPAGVLTAYIYSLTYQLPPPQDAIGVGDRAVTFRLRDFDGEEVALDEVLSDARTEWVVLDFFRGPW